VGLTDVVPHLVENALKEGGGQYSKADAFALYTRRDGRLITGQNPPSSEPTAKLLLEALGK
jgi:putative intracellular protease/amidase